MINGEVRTSDEALASHYRTYRKLALHYGRKLYERGYVIQSKQGCIAKESFSEDSVAVKITRMTREEL